MILRLLKPILGIPIGDYQVCNNTSTKQLDICYTVEGIMESVGILYEDENAYKVIELSDTDQVILLNSNL